MQEIFPFRENDGGPRRGREALVFSARFYYNRADMPGRGRRPERKDWTITMKLGIVGLPNVGKSTLFNAITNAGAESANYPFCTIDPNVGMVHRPRRAAGQAGRDLSPQENHPLPVIEFVDIAGLVKGASQGGGPGQQVFGQHPGDRRHRPRGALL